MFKGWRGFEIYMDLGYLKGYIFSERVELKRELKRN